MNITANKLIALLAVIPLFAIGQGNHAFQHCQTGNSKEYSKIEETMSPEVLQIVADWILQHVKPAP